MYFNATKTCTFLAAILFVMGPTHLNAAPQHKPPVAEGGPIVEGFQLLAQTDREVFAPSTPITLSIILQEHH